jgi:hypothetical protein
MEMEPILKSFTLVGIASLAVAIWFLVSFSKRAIALSFPKLRKVQAVSKTSNTILYQTPFSRTYNELLIYLFPYVWALLLAIPKIDFVYATADGYGGRALFGCLVATFAGLVYKCFRKAIPKLFGVDVEDTGNDPVDALSLDQDSK